MLLWTLGYIQLIAIECLFGAKQSSGHWDTAMNKPNPTSASLSLHPKVGFGSQTHLGILLDSMMRFMRLELGERPGPQFREGWAVNALGSRRLAWVLKGWPEFGGTTRSWREFWKENKVTENTGRQTAEWRSRDRGGRGELVEERGERRAGEDWKVGGSLALWHLEQT